MTPETPTAVTPLEKLQFHLNIIIADFHGPRLYNQKPDLVISEYLTADNYDVHILTNDEKEIQWENDVYYYKPDFNTIMERIEEVANDVPEALIQVSSIEEYFEDYEIENWLNDNIDDDGTE